MDLALAAVRLQSAHHTQRPKPPGLIDSWLENRALPFLQALEIAAVHQG